MRTDLPIRAIQHNQHADDGIGVRHRRYDTPNADARSKNRKQKRFGYTRTIRGNKDFSLMYAICNDARFRVKSQPQEAGSSVGSFVCLSVGWWLLTE